jgi:hypothetical protein
MMLCSSFSYSNTRGVTSHLCNRCVREFLILARTWFAFGLPCKTGCDKIRTTSFGSPGSFLALMYNNGPLFRRYLHSKICWMEYCFEGIERPSTNDCQKLIELVVHDACWYVMPSECYFELSPLNHVVSRLHSEEMVPPCLSGPTKLLGGETDLGRI